MNYPGNTTVPAPQRGCDGDPEEKVAGSGISHGEESPSQRRRQERNNLHKTEMAVQEASVPQAMGLAWYQSSGGPATEQSDVVPAKNDVRYSAPCEFLNLPLTLA